VKITAQYNYSKTLNPTIPTQPLYRLIDVMVLIVINVKKTEFKTVFNGDTAYITQLKQQKSKRCYYFGSTSP